jgi:hypothetical protein
VRTTSPDAPYLMIKIFTVWPSHLLERLFGNSPDFECVPPFTHPIFTRTARFKSTYSPCTFTGKPIRLLVHAVPLRLSSSYLMQVANLRCGEGGQMAVTVQMQFESAVTEMSEEAFVGSAIENGTTMIIFALRKLRCCIRKP